MVAAWRNLRSRSHSHLAWSFRDIRHAQHEVGDRGDNHALLFFRELAVDWNGQRIASRALSSGETAGPIPKALEAGLPMKRHRVVDFVSDPPFVELPLQRVTRRDANNILIEN